MDKTRYISIALFMVLVGCTPKQLIQTGYVAMPHQERRTTDPWQMVYREHVNFPKPFSSVPQIQISLRSIEAYTRRQGMFYQLNTTNVDTNGFELQIYGAYMDSFSNCIVNWTAVGFQ